MMEDNVNFSLARSNEGEKRRKSTAGRNQVNHFSIHSEAFFHQKMNLCHKDEE